MAPSNKQKEKEERGVEKKAREESEAKRLSPGTHGN